MALRAGRLNRRIELQSKANSIGAGGTLTEAWSTQATVWARIEPLAGREQYSAQQIEGVSSYEVTIRHLGTVTNKWRVVHGSQTLAIRAVLNPGTKSEATVLICDEQDNEEGA